MPEKNYIKPLIIGNVKIPHNVILAPLAGVSDFPFRQLVRDFGAQLTFTEMININAYLHQPKQTEALMKIKKHEHPIGIQLMGVNAKDFRRIIPQVETYDPDLIDINFGCPVKKVTKTGGGASLLKDTDKIHQIIETANKAATIPIMAKIRLGWENKEGLSEIVHAIEDGGAAAITIHGRTQRQAYSGEVDLEAMALVKATAKIPVIGNGDIFDAQSAELMFKETGVDGIMLARGTFGNPALFSEILDELGNNKPITSKNINLIDILLKHYRLEVEEYGEKNAIYKMRKIALWYLNLTENVEDVKKKILKLKSFEEVKELLENIKREM
ncbi:MAG: tRNA dihydrouridine synthase DusB [Calditrichia bacterium]|nr:tRNA dihydrouridine synthase DusB [Calditrichia bacterium]